MSTLGGGGGQFEMGEDRVPNGVVGLKTMTL